MPSLGRILERLTVAVDGDTSDAESKLHGLSDESKGGSWVGKLGGAAAKAGGLLAVGVGAGAFAMGTLGIAAGASAEQANIAFTSIMGDAGKAKAFMGELSAFAACVDEETEAFTFDGWKRYDDLAVGDLILTVNVATGLAEWQPIEEVYIHAAGMRRLINIESNNHSSLTTLNHRWPIYTRGQHKNRVLMATSETLCVGDKLIGAAPLAEGPEEGTHSDAFVEVVGWFWTEGHIHATDGALDGPKSCATIRQSMRANPDKVERIGAALTGAFGPAGRGNWSTDGPDAEGCMTFRLARDVAKQLVAVAPDRVPTMEFLHGLTTDQLELFIAVSLLGDGHVRPQTGQMNLTQKRQDMAERFADAVSLSGRVCRVYSSVEQGRRRWVVSVYRTAPTIGISHAGRDETKMQTIAHDRLVWCPRVANGTWFARRHGRRFFTGNSTPFELPGLRDSASQMLAVGVNAKDVIPIMRTLGDSTSAMGTGADGIQRAVMALTQMQVKGKVTGEEMLQLAEAGVPAWDALATVMGVSVPQAQEAVSKGQVKVNTLMSAIETSAGPALGRVKGMMDKQSQSLTGLWSTLKDTVGQGLGDMMGPAIQQIEKQLPAVTSTIGASLALIGPQVSTLMTGVVGILGDLLPSVAPLLGAVAQALGESFKTLGPALAQLGPPLLRVFEALLPVLPALAGALAALVPALIPLINGFAKLLELIPPNVLAAIVVAFVAFEPVVAIFGALSAILPILAVGFELLLGPVGLVILAVAALAAAGYLIYRNWDTIVEFFSGLWDTVSQAFMTGVDATVGFVESLPGRALDALAALPGLLGHLATQAIRSLLAEFWAFPDQVVDAVSTLAPKLVGAWYDVQVWLGRAVWDGLVWLAGIVAELPGMAVNGLANLGPMLARAGWEAMQAMWKGMVWIADSLWNLFLSLPGNLVNALSNLAGMLSNVGYDAVMGLWHGIERLAGWLKDKVWGWVKDVLPAPIMKALGMASPSRVMMGIGENAGLGLAQGLLGTASDVAAAAGSLAGAAQPSLAGSSFASSVSGPGVGGGGGGGTTVIQMENATMTVDQFFRRFRVLAIDDGGRNAFATALG